MEESKNLQQKVKIPQYEQQIKQTEWKKKDEQRLRDIKDYNEISNIGVFERQEKEIWPKKVF